MTDIHPGLVALAEAMDAVPDVATDSLGRPWACERCPREKCGAAIIPPGTEGRLAHLMSSHGWRMNGTRYDNQNTVLEVL